MKVLITVSAGFIGSNLALSLLEHGDSVAGIDNHSDYYDSATEEGRLARYANRPKYTHLSIDLVDRKAIEECFATHKLQGLVNLAAQAGLRYLNETHSLPLTETSLAWSTSPMAVGTTASSISHTPVDPASMSPTRPCRSRRITTPSIRSVSTLPAKKATK